MGKRVEYVGERTEMLDQNWREAWETHRRDVSRMFWQRFFLDLQGNRKYRLFNGIETIGS